MVFSDPVCFTYKKGGLSVNNGKKYKKNDGLYLRGEVWWFNITVPGQGNIRRSTGTKNKKLAQAIRAKVLTMVTEKKWFDIEEESEHTYDDMMDRFMREYAVHQVEPSTQDMYHYARKHLDLVFHGKPLSRITDAEIDEYMLDRLEEGASPATCNRELSTLSIAFTQATKKWKWIKGNPCLLVSKLPENNIQDIWLSAEQEKLLLEAAKKYLHGDLPDIILFAIHTGARRKEILFTDKKQVDLKRRAITLLRTKNKEPRTVPMNNTLYNMLARRFASDTREHGWLFVTSTGKQIGPRNLDKTFRLALKNAKIEKFWFHGLRHTFGTRLAQAGKSSHEIGALMGIKTEKVLKRYMHHNVESLRNAVHSLDQRHLRVVEGKR